MGGGNACMGDVAGQTRRCPGMIVAALAEAGAELENVVLPRIMLTGSARRRQAAEEHGAVFGAIRAATTVVQVVAFVEPEWLLELEADAVLL